MMGHGPDRPMSVETPTRQGATVRYTLQGAAFLLRVPENTLRGWANGYTARLTYKDVYKPGILGGDREDDHLFTFQELVELLYVKELLKPYKGPPRQVAVEDPELRDALKEPKTVKRKLEDIRHLAEYLREKIGPYPFARSRMKTVGDQLVTQEVEPGLWTNPLLQQHLLECAEELVNSLEFDNDNLATLWYPDENSKLIVINPNVRWGRPIVVSGVSTQAIYDRCQAGESIEEVAEWFDVPPEEVLAAIHFEEVWQSKAQKAA